MFKRTGSAQANASSASSEWLHLFFFAMLLRKNLALGADLFRTYGALSIKKYHQHPYRGSMRIWWSNVSFAHPTASES